MKSISGKVITVGNNISATSILPPEFYGELMESISPSRVFEAESDIDLSAEDEIILVVRQNFGHGSANESVLMALKKAGVQAIIGTEFPNYVYRNGLNLGLPIFISERVADDCSNGDSMTIDADSGVIKNETTGNEFQMEDRPDFIRRLMEMGGVTAFIQTLREQDMEENS